MTTTNWVPGEPLYAHPSARPQGEGSYVRELFQLLYDEDHAVRTLEAREDQAVCLDCLVAWSAVDEGPRCWVCSEEAHNATTAEMNERHQREVRYTYAALVGGPPQVSGRAYCVEYNDPTDLDSVVVFQHLAVGSDYWAPLYNRRKWPEDVIALRYVRTARWQMNCLAWVFEYEGEVTADAYA